MRRGFVPAAPFVGLLRDRLEELERPDISAPRQALVEDSGIHERLIYLLLHGKQDNISFDNADKIVTNLVGPMAWYSRPELYEVYSTVDLAYVDSRWPVSEAVAA